MDQNLADAIAELQAQGIPVAVDRSEHGAEMYIATAPNEEKYELDGAALLELKAEGRLHLEGLQEAHLAKKDIPNLSKTMNASCPADRISGSDALTDSYRG